VHQGPTGGSAAPPEVAGSSPEAPGCGPPLHAPAATPPPVVLTLDESQDLRCVPPRLPVTELGQVEPGLPVAKLEPETKLPASRRPYRLVFSWRQSMPRLFLQIAVTSYYTQNHSEFLLYLFTY